MVEFFLPIGVAHIAPVTISLGVGLPGWIIVISPLVERCKCCFRTIPCALLWISEKGLLVVLESMATGRPAVVTNISGSQDLVLDGETGFVVEPRDEEGLARALLELLQDEAKRERFGETAARRADDYSWDRISRRYLDLA